MNRRIYPQLIFIVLFATIGMIFGGYRYNIYIFSYVVMLLSVVVTLFDKVKGTIFITGILIGSLIGILPFPFNFGLELSAQSDTSAMSLNLVVLVLLIIHLIRSWQMHQQFIDELNGRES